MTRWYQLLQATPVARTLADGSATARRDDRTEPNPANGSHDEPKQGGEMVTGLDREVAIGPAGCCFDIDSAIDGEPAWLSYLASGPDEPTRPAEVRH